MKILGNILNYFTRPFAYDDGKTETMKVMVQKPYEEEKSDE